MVAISEMKRSAFFYGPVLIFIPVVILLYISVEMLLDGRGLEEPQAQGGITQSRHARESFLEAPKPRDGVGSKEELKRMVVLPAGQEDQGHGDPAQDPGQLQEVHSVKKDAGRVTYPPFVNVTNKLGGF